MVRRPSGSRLVRADQSSSSFELDELFELELDDEFELELLDEFELELDELFELELLDEFELEFDDEFELELEFELDDPPPRLSSSSWCRQLRASNRTSPPRAGRAGVGAEQLVEEPLERVVRGAAVGGGGDRGRRQKGADQADPEWFHFRAG